MDPLDAFHQQLDSEALLKRHMPDLVKDAREILANDPTARVAVQSFREPRRRTAPVAEPFRHESASSRRRSMQLFDLLQVLDPPVTPKLCKIHLAGWNGKDDPLDVYLAGRFDEWQEEQTKRNSVAPGAYLPAVPNEGAQ